MINIHFCRFLSPFPVGTRIFTRTTRQAAAAVTLLDGYVAPWTSSVGSENTEVGYEIHFTARLHSPINNDTDTCQLTEMDTSDTSLWNDEMRRLVEIAERDDATTQGPSIVAEVFEPLRPDKLEPPNDNDVITFMDLEHRPMGAHFLEDMESSEEDALTGNSKTNMVFPP